VNHTATVETGRPVSPVMNSGEDLALNLRQRNLLVAVKVLLLVSAPFWLWALFFAGNYEFGTSLLFVPILWLFNISAIQHITKSHPALRRVMLLGFTMKMASTGGYMAFQYVYYRNGMDATTYYNIGKQWATYYSTHGSYPIVGHLWGTSFLNLLSGVLVNILGPSFPTISALFAAASFWGMYFFYDAFRSAFPNGRKEFCALLLFFLPSCQFWTAALGKDALMMLSIGMASYGFTEVMATRIARGTVFLVPAMTLGFFTRPHIAGMVAIAMLFPYTFALGKKGVAAAAARVLGIPVMAAGVVYLVRNATKLLNVDSATGGLERIEKLGAATTYGGSSFGQGQSTAVRLLLSPFLMFRPFPWEIPNLLGVIATAEALVLLYFLWQNRQELVGMLVSWRYHAFFTYAVTFGVLYSVVFSLALSNFGLLIRQRTQYTPFLVILAAASLSAARIRRSV